MSNRIVFKETVFQPVNGYVLKESINPETNKVDGVIIEGDALDTTKPTRNKILYDYNSVMNSHKKLEGRPMLLNHDEAKLPVGHIEKVWMEGPILKYRGNIDPEETDLVRKIKRGDINNVSIQALVDEVSHEESIDGKQYTRAFPNDWAEISIVTIPGYADSTINMAEALKLSHIGKEKLVTASIEKKDEDFFENIIKKNKLKVHTKTREGGNINYVLDDGVEEEIKVEDEPVKDEIIKEEIKTEDEQKKEDISTINAGTLVGGPALTKTIRKDVEPTKKELEEILEVIKACQV